jgi:hypothetical protein
MIYEVTFTLIQIKSILGVDQVALILIYLRNVYAILDIESHPMVSVMRWIVDQVALILIYLRNVYAILDIESYPMGNVINKFLISFMKKLLLLVFLSATTTF